MGTYYVNAVLNGLKGREKIGNKKITAPWLALLVSIANKQPNPGSYHGDMDPICVGDRKTMAEYAHICEAEVDKVRKFLVKNGLITYSKNEIKENPASGEEQEFRNVYRINLKTLRAFHPNVEQWKRKILRISKEDEASEGILRALMALPDSDPKVYEVDPKVYEVGKKVYEVDKKVYDVDTNINKTKIKTNNNKDKCSDVADDVVADDVVNHVIEAMSQNLGVQRNEIGRNAIINAIKGKFTDSVYDAVDNPIDFVRNANNKIGAMIAVLSKLPAKRDDPAFQNMAKKEENAKKEEYLRIIGDATPDARSMLGTIQKNTGYGTPKFLADMTTFLNVLLYYSDEKRDKAVEICGRYKLEESDRGNKKRSRELAKKLWEELKEEYSKCFGNQETK